MALPRPRKRFGQHFLISPDIIAEIVRVIAPVPDRTVVEIGPGRGALTIPLLESGARLVAVEIEKDAAGYLGRTLRDHPRFRLLRQDFLGLEPEQVGTGRFILVGNLPYSITSPVIDWVIRHRVRIERACFMVQKELADRLGAAPNSKDWSPLSIFTQRCLRVIRHFDVGPENFKPRPKVMSTVISLRPVKTATLPDPGLFEKVVRASFRHRRKLLVNNLVPEMVESAEEARGLLRAAGLAENCRAEQVGIGQFSELTKRIGEDRMRFDTDNS